MATSNHRKEEHPHPKHPDDMDIIVQTLPKIEVGWWIQYICEYQGFWIPLELVKGVLTLRKDFIPQPSHVILASFIKTGTTWLQALLVTIMNPNRRDNSTNPLLTMNPHQIVPWMESYAREVHLMPVLHETSLLTTHLPYVCLPEQIKMSLGCPIIYVCRNPKDVLVSLWCFLNKARVMQGIPCVPLEEAFDGFCDGTGPFGSYWDHVLGYWKASLKFPSKVLFLTYEDLQRDPLVHVKRLAEFVGHPFSFEEENEGVVQKVIEFCSFKNLSNLAVNKDESSGPKVLDVMGVRYNMFFRKGEIGDYKNYLTETMVKRLEEITEHKLRGSGATMPLWSQSNSRAA